MPDGTFGQCVCTPFGADDSGTDSGHGNSDGGAHDSGGLPPDGGGLPPDGGGLPPDGGGLPPDGGGLPPDGGGLLPDGGGLLPDGGGLLPDGGGVTDAGITADSGAPFDAGTDSGTIVLTCPGFQSDGGAPDVALAFLNVERFPVTMVGGHFRTLGADELASANAYGAEVSDLSRQAISQIQVVGFRAAGGYESVARGPVSSVTGLAQLIIYGSAVTQGPYHYAGVELCGWDSPSQAILCSPPVTFVIGTGTTVQGVAADSLGNAYVSVNGELYFADGGGPLNATAVGSLASGVSPVGPFVAGLGPGSLDIWWPGFARNTQVPIVAGNVIATGDFDGKNGDDIAVGSVGGGIWIFLGQGDGGFSLSTSLATGFAISSIDVADFNSDCLPDLSVTDDNAGVQILLNDGGGQFSAIAANTLPCHGDVAGPLSQGVGAFHGNDLPDVECVAPTSLFGWQLFPWSNAGVCQPHCPSPDAGPTDGG